MKNNNSILTREVVFDFLKKNKGKKYTVNNLFNDMKSELGDRYNINYPTVLKWIEVLIAIKKIRYEKLGMMKVVWYGEN